MKKALQVTALIAFLGASACAERVVRDEFDRDIKVPDHPHRLICLAPSITDTVYALGRGNDIVGITDYTEYPPEARQKPSVGGPVNPSLEKLASLKPDLVLEVGDLNSADLTRSIERLGFPVFVIQPHGLQGVYRSIRNIGKVIDAEPQASALVARLQEREAAVRKRVAGRPRPGIFFLLWPDPVMTAGHGAFITELIEAAGGNSITADLPNEWPRISLESVLARQPDYVMLVEGSNVTLEGLRHQGNWIRLQAVRDGKILYTDHHIEFPSPVALDALESLAEQLHPAGAHKD